MTDAIEQFEHRGFTIKILPDPDPMDPRDCDNLGTMACFHRRYKLGDEQPDGDGKEFLLSLLPGTVVERLENRRDRECYMAADYDGRKQVYADFHARVMAEVEKQFIVLPLYLYDHSGITMNTTGFHCPWDSGQVGIIYVSKAKVLKEYGKKVVTKAVREKALACLRQEVETYDLYLRGGFVGYVVEDADGEHIDSCWSFDDLDYCRQTAKNAADSAADDREEAERSEAADIEAESRADGGF